MDRPQPIYQGGAMDPDLETEIQRLRQYKVKELKRFRELFVEDSTSSNRAHLFRRVAWRVQARGAGELRERAQQRAVELADDAELRRRAPRSFWRSREGRNASAQRDPRLREVGRRLTCSYQAAPEPLPLDIHHFGLRESSMGARPVLCPAERRTAANSQA